MVNSKGKPIYELVDPDGNVYALQAHEERFPIESLDKLGEQLRAETATPKYALDAGRRVGSAFLGFGKARFRFHGAEPQASLS